MGNKRSYTAILLTFTIALGGLFGFAYAQDTSTDNIDPASISNSIYTTDTTNTVVSSDGVPVTTTVSSVRVLLSIYDVACDGTATFGTVVFKEDPNAGFRYTVEGAGVRYAFLAGVAQRLPVGEYRWISTTPLDTRAEPAEGVFRIEEKCAPVSDTTVTSQDEIVDTSQTNDVTTPASDTNGETSVLLLYPPQNFDLLREDGVTFVLVDAGSAGGNDLYAYHIYRRCEDAAWWSLAKVRVAECGGYACSYQVTDRSNGDTCEYAVASIDSTGRESEQTPPKRPPYVAPVVTTNIIDATTVNTTDQTQTAPPTNVTITTSEVVLTTEDVERHLALGKYIMLLRTSGATGVEWNMYPEASKTATYLGKAIYNKDKDYWEYVWDTTKVPNGDYTLVPKIVSLTGARYEDVPVRVRVKNEAAPVTKDTSLVDIVKEASTEVQKVVIDANTQDKAVKENLIKTLTPYAEDLQKYVDEKGTDATQQELRDEKARIEKELTMLLNIESSKLLSALNGDEEEFKRFENRVIIAAERSTDNIDAIAEEFGISLDEKERAQLEKEVSKALQELRGILQERREVLKDRVGDRVFEDTDKDGVSNYDEVNIYNTDPQNPDTDNDGFFDGAELLGGFDPLNPAREAVVEYEEPQTEGFLEEDTFSVETVEVSEKITLDDGREDAAKIVLQGKAPANSFATVYIYSTPVIVTVKTDEYGNWIYELDKELEDGNHEVYVAITDNAGKIYAKSKPLPFVKEAAAVTIDESALFTNNTGEPSLFASAYMYIIVLIIIGVIGWALIFTGSRQTRIE
jgi:hypothetical protein